MLRVYQRILGLLPQLVPVLAAMERRDLDLARQLRRALASVALNICEGSGNEGGTRRQRFLSALGSLRESIAALEVAEALGYVVLPSELLRELGRGTLHPRGGGGRHHAAASSLAGKPGEKQPGAIRCRTRSDRRSFAATSSMP